MAAKKDKQKNPMRDICVDKLVLNIGTGSESQPQENAKRLLTLITGRKPADSIAKRRNPTFKISKGNKIGAFVTVRGSAADELFKKLVGAVDNKVKESSLTNNTLNFGIKEYIDISGIKYDPKIGMLGMNVNVAFRRRGGARVAIKKRANGRIKFSHKIIKPEELGEMLKEKYDVQVGAVQ